MRILTILFFFVCYLTAQNITCEYIEKNPTYLKNVDYTNQNIQNIIASCKSSFKNQAFTQKLYKLANDIRGSNSSCSGISYMPKLNHFNSLLLEFALNPRSLNNKISEEKNKKLKTYFRYWGYQTIGNYRLYTQFWSEYEKTFEKLKQYFQTNFSFNANENTLYANNVLNEFLNWAVGETKIIRDISPISKVFVDKNYNLTKLQEYIYKNNPTREELTLGLHTALLKGVSKDSIELLLQMGAQLEAGYESAIFYALENYESVKFLIDEGANVNFTNVFGKSPLFYAIEFGQKDIVRLLIANGANVNQKYINNNEKLALSTNNTNAPYFITFCALEHTSKNVLMHAAAYGDVEILKLLVENRALLNEVDDLGFNALDFALAAKKDENVKYLSTLGLKATDNLYYGGTLE
ncbi:MULTISPECIES: ankyrin repeat domain-containing protein [unclassified Campylobacter]|uniref:ankyrin repeat domain-containing protein n=1 Tax=unclassified Campylobacter TaxID=2593542 RepID=UPI001237D73E|nr:MULTISPECIES: ankyrin repeat domain-containing protein [unclassified Campylobacter]KAA6224894.1 hypothetical protein FMM54_06890 [Campylobacter sp. LR185c]KAA6226321.1 hypothetical protein FMM57_05950 [Campylobacter sp. LR286c]KAA6226813.1 hypothetical protein FMM55_04520 [Campylobacter sp. LR196d]KAA6230250.1 hypothetical protein FMM58_06150 [Campylobacter sp. LR291e]KAA8604215.1 hypothetical protein CGP82_03225 [Campylobacter sp. LR185c]